MARSFQRFTSGVSRIELERSSKRLKILDDIIDSEEANHQWNASAITHIDGRDVIDYLTDFANLNSVGGIEPNADWNQLSSSASFLCLIPKLIFPK